jgi:hypothetical protein
LPRNESQAADVTQTAAPRGDYEVPGTQVMIGERASSLVPLDGVVFSSSLPIGANQCVFLIAGVVCVSAEMLLCSFKSCASVVNHYSQPWFAGCCGDAVWQAQHRLGLSAYETKMFSSKC